MFSSRLLFAFAAPEAMPLFFDGRDRVESAELNL
jgi:hypothetical protein